MSLGNVSAETGQDHYSKPRGLWRPETILKTGRTPKSLMSRKIFEGYVFMTNNNSLPPGSYQNSCTDICIENPGPATIITANCKTINGDTNVSSVYYSYLQSLNIADIANVNGKLIIQMAWSHIPQSNLNVNSALLQSAKSLLQGIYTYIGYAIGGAAGTDYLPISYNISTSNPDTVSQTQYLIHASNNTYVNWINPSLAWASTPNYGELKQYAGTVAQGTASSTAQCWTDCSGFITAIFAYINQQLNIQTVFQNWKLNSSIPEAGCFDPTSGCNNPNPENYYSLITQPGSSNPPNQFQSIALSDLQPGDLIVYASGTESAGDTGHIMLVAAVLVMTAGMVYTLPDNSAHTAGENGGTLVVVIDETQDPHSCDSRGTKPTQTSTNSNGITGLGIGAGMGIIELYESDAAIQFCWSVGANPQSATYPTSAVVLGRAAAA
ncbi:hypothetical protein F6R98_12765 [Candidatus Methylospira mobilis]|uniref:Uncharacterized protein n=1 Tax=Candidatus Methylospira mobilis TaxID=1808979 RepID=A0A5Q0BM99_9GAMM|nr:hypothetical protein [Candidatus Methylospira mobilis]QFY43381.1 hypothetical protein F6R98_12765 [Candidatus Methylospira mobilis]